MVTALANSKKPRPVREHRNGASRTCHRPITRGTDPVALTLEHGVPRPIADDDSIPQFRVPASINVTALAAALDAQLNGADVTDEVDGFLAAVAGAFAMGMEHQRNLPGVS